MNDEKFKDTLQACFYGDKGAYNKCMYEYQHRGLRLKELEQINEEHRKLNGQLRENWNKIREWVEEQQKEPKPTISITFTRTLIKMKELEEGDNK